MSRGQVIIVIATVVGSVFASAIGAWATANKQVADVRVEVAAIKATQSSQYNEIINRLNSIDRKLDR